MFKWLQSHVITLYRLVAMSVLMLIIIGVISYLSLLVFYAGNRSWAAPLTLSPTQDKVLAFQPQVAALEDALLRQRVDLNTAESKYSVGSKQLLNLEALLRRVDGAQKTEAAALAATNKQIKTVLTQKSIDIADTTKAVQKAKQMLAAIDAEQQARLITKDQAQEQRLALQSALNAATDAKAALIALQEQQRSAQAAASTLTGGGTSLQALQSLQQEMQIRVMAAQLSIDVETARQTVTQLKTSIQESERVLAVAKISPYYEALRAPVSVLFVPYENFKHVQAGTPVYDCYLQVLLCRKVGVTTTEFPAEQYFQHPLFKTDLKGMFIGVQFSNSTAKTSDVVFIGRKPLFL